MRLNKRAPRHTRLQIWLILMPRSQPDCSRLPTALSTVGACPLRVSRWRFPPGHKTGAQPDCQPSDKTDLSGHLMFWIHACVLSGRRASRPPPSAGYCPRARHGSRSDHSIGSLPILTMVESHPELLERETRLDYFVNKLSPIIGKQILET